MTAKYLVDTDWVIHYLKGHPAIQRRLTPLAREGLLALSIVSLAELYEGVYYSDDPEAHEAKLAELVRGIEVLNIEDATCRLFAKERGRLRTLKKQIADLDLFIGMTARQHELTLLTNNRRHFTLLEGLALESV